MLIIFTTMGQSLEYSKASRLELVTKELNQFGDRIVFLRLGTAVSVPSAQSQKNDAIPLKGFNSI